MPTLPPVPLPLIPATPPTLPLTPDVRKAYQDLYDKYEDAIESTSDGIALATLNPSRLQVDTVLDLDDTYRKDKNTALFNDLLDQISSTNKDLVTLKDQIAAVASHISTAADIIAAIDKVVTLVPSF